MSVVTRVTEHPRKPGRYVVEVDGREFAIVGAEVMAETKTGIGVIVDDALAARLREADELTRTYDRALDLLAFRARSARELRQRLLQKGESKERIEKVIERLRDARLIDDADFARQLTRAKLAGGASRRRVHQELFRRGVAREVADDAVQQVLDEEGITDAASIERVARKKWGTLARLDAPTRRRRLYAFLARRGFDSDEISRVVRLLAGEAPESTVES